MHSKSSSHIGLKVILIAAIGSNNELGRNNDLLWRLKSDMDFFKRTTTNHQVIMGRKSWESLPPKFRPLPNRQNVVITRDPAFAADGCIVHYSLEKALQEASHTGLKNVFVIGGGQLYSHALQQELVDEMYLTHVGATFADADVLFPAIRESEWEKELIETFTSDDRNDYNGAIWHYVKIRS